MSSPLKSGLAGSVTCFSTEHDEGDTVPVLGLNLKTWVLLLLLIALSCPVKTMVTLLERPHGELRCRGHMEREQFQT